MQLYYEAFGVDPYFLLHTSVFFLPPFYLSPYWKYSNFHVIISLHVGYPPLVEQGSAFIRRAFFLSIIIG